MWSMRPTDGVLLQWIPGYRSVETKMQLNLCIFWINQRRSRTYERSEKNSNNMRERAQFWCYVGSTCSVSFFSTSRKSVKMTFLDSHRECHVETRIVGKL